MCGIVGFISKDQNKMNIIENMANRIKHRGPDGEGYYVDEQIALGQRRLAIIDLSDNGKQPMYNEDGSIVVIFNGEIYNYIELKEELLKKDHIFMSTSDTEVLVHGYEEYGEDLPSKLHGMFAFAIYDINKKTLFCSRDPFGIKPFYYYQNDEVFMLASEIKAFLEHPSFKKELNTDMLGPYLSFSFTPTNETFFKNVYQLKAGYSLNVVDYHISTKRYYFLTFNQTNMEYDQMINQVAETMKESVDYHMISDVEVGAFLSSGIDSSYLVALARPNKTYTVGYDISKYDETDYAKDLAERLHIENISKKISKEEYINQFPKIIYYMDEPIADPAAIALYFLAGLASQDVKVVLSGEGADEFFGGYNSYKQEIDYKFYYRIPSMIRKLIGRVCQLLPEMWGINFLVRHSSNLENFYIGVSKVFSERQIKKILTIKSKHKPTDITKQVYQEQTGQDAITKMQAIDINFWLAKDILHKADRMCMAHSLEARVPFTDIDVFDTASKIPTFLKVNKETTKVALREAAKNVIPNKSYQKKKLGFPVPVREWMKDDDVYQLIKETFSKPIAKELFHYPKIIKLLDDHKSGKKDNYRKVWTIFAFLTWYQVYFETPTETISA